MSVTLPVCSLVFGSVTPPQSDVIELRVHLGCSKEVGSFDCLLQNFDKKYSPGGTYPINVGDDGSISIGRGANNPLIATITVEEIKAFSDSHGENYLRVLGRCWGERIFRRVVTKAYENQKGEAIVKDLMDYYVGLSHVRDGVELIEDTDTTYTKLEYENTPVFDILKYIAETADKAGVIGFDFRVAPDGKFEFFPCNSKTSSVSLSERLEESEYRKSALRKRDKIFVYGAAEKKYPSNGDSWTESLDINNDQIDDWQSGTGSGSVSLDGSTKAVGSYSIKHTLGIADYYGRLRLIIPSGWQPNLNKYPTLQFAIRREAAFNGACTIILQDNAGRWVAREFQISADKWVNQKFLVGKKYADEWQGDANFNWEIINEIMWDMWFAGTGTGNFWVDNLFFNGARWSATYGTGSRELSETDEELHSDNECLLRAKALHNHLSSPAEYIKVTSDVIDYGTTPILAGDRIWATLPNENVDGYYRVISVEYRLIAETQTLETTLELGKEPPLLADYLYGLRATTVTVEKLARTKLGKDFGGVAGGGGGGGVGPHHTAHEAGDNNGNQWPDPKDGGSDKIMGWISPRFLGPFDDSAAMIQFRTKNKAGTQILDHQFNPMDDGYGVLGSATKKWKEINVAQLGRFGWLKTGELNIGDFIVITSARVLQNVTADAAIITSGVFGEARIPDVFTTLRTFNGGITMGAALNMNSQSIQNLNRINQCMPPGANQGYVGDTATYWYCIAGNSVWYKALGQFDALDDLALIKKIRSNGKVDEKGIPLADPESLPPEVTENGLINAGALMGMLIGAVKQLAAKVDSLSQELEKAKAGVPA